VCETFNVVSSAKDNTLVVGMVLAISLMYNINKREPKMEPWVIPQVTSNTFDQ